MTERLSELLDATAVLQTYSRLVIDCNRNPSWPTAMPEISEHTPVPAAARFRSYCLLALIFDFHDEKAEDVARKIKVNEVLLEKRMPRNRSIH